MVMSNHNQLPVNPLEVQRQRQELLDVQLKFTERLKQLDIFETVKTRADLDEEATIILAAPALEHIGIPGTPATRSSIILTTQRISGNGSRTTDTYPMPVALNRRSRITLLNGFSPWEYSNVQKGIFEVLEAQEEKQLCLSDDLTSIVAPDGSIPAHPSIKNHEATD
jgi:hypothetical protein